MGDAYWDAHSVEMRLDETICLYQGKPVYVQVDRDRLGDGHTLKAYKLDGRMRNPTRVDYRTEDFDYRAFPLGYMNSDRNAYYLTRVPARQQKQGLERRQLRGIPELPHMEGWFYGRDMEDCILGRYPSVPEALEKLDTYAVESIAVSRNVAIRMRSTGGTKLLYKGRTIGHRKADGSFALIESKETKALRGVIQEELGDALCLTT